MQTETFKDIQGYEGLYRVSNLGNVMRSKSERILRPRRHMEGYQLVTLSKHGVVKQCSIHRLVALTFLPNPEEKEQVNHIDGVKSNNSLSNLEWCTQSENIVHSLEVIGNQHGGQRGVIQYNKDWNEIARFTSIRGASIATGVNEGNIGLACRCKLKSAGWFRWKYA